MSDYTPTTAEIRGHYSWKSSSIVGALEYSEGLSEFERWLAAHDAEVADKAQRKCVLLGWKGAATWLDGMATRTSQVDLNVSAAFSQASSAIRDEVKRCKTETEGKR